MSPSNDYFNDDTILMRNDGKKMKPISIKNPEPDESDDLKRHSDDNVDGFKTHIHCRWCNRIIRDVYIPKLKNGINGKPCDVTYNYEPCDECRKTWNTMVIFIEVSRDEPYRDCLPIDSDLRQIEGYIDPDKDPDEYARRVEKEEIERDGSDVHTIQYERVFFFPTGRYAGVTVDATKKYFTGNTNNIHNGSVIYLEQDMFERAFADYFENRTFAR